MPNGRRELPSKMILGDLMILSTLCISSNYFIYWTISERQLNGRCESHQTFLDDSTTLCISSNYFYLINGSKNRFSPHIFPKGCQMTDVSSHPKWFWMVSWSYQLIKLFYLLDQRTASGHASFRKAAKWPMWAPIQSDFWMISWSHQLFASHQTILFTQWIKEPLQIMHLSERQPNGRCESHPKFSGWSHDFNNSLHLIKLFLFNQWIKESL